MKDSKSLKELVRNKYAQIALQDKSSNQSSCCGSGSCSTEVYNIMTDDYSQLKGYSEEADLGLGCGLPTQFAQIKKGHTVVDLGSGAGNDCFVARAETGAEGKVIGIDFTDAMIAKAKENAQALGFENVEFRHGDIEDIPLANNVADVVISNCVLNLVPDKHKVFSEIFRILKPGGHFSISDVVLEGELPEQLQQAAEMYAGCVSGAIPKNQYLQFIGNNGFTQATIQKIKAIHIPDDILSHYLNTTELEQYHEGRFGIFSITVFAKKPELSSACCAGGCCN